MSTLSGCKGALAEDVEDTLRLTVEELGDGDNSVVSSSSVVLDLVLTDDASIPSAQLLVIFIEKSCKICYEIGPCSGPLI